jgi:O-methyltransferase
LTIEGDRIECGVFRGLSAAVLAAVAKMRNPQFTGEQLHLADSFQGLSAPTIEDVISHTTDQNGNVKMQVGANKGQFSTPEDMVKQALIDYPDISYHAGWIPEILNDFPERNYSFLHIDVDLYAPTRGCLEYFWPRLGKGGVII